MYFNVPCHPTGEASLTEPVEGLWTLQSQYIRAKLSFPEARNHWFNSFPESLTPNSFLG